MNYNNKYETLSKFHVINAAGDRRSRPHNNNYNTRNLGTKAVVFINLVAVYIFLPSKFSAPINAELNSQISLRLLVFRYMKINIKKKF